MTFQVFVRIFDSEGPRALHVGVMSEWSRLDALHVPAMQSNFEDLTSWDPHWATKDWSCCLGSLQVTRSSPSLLVIISSYFANSWSKKDLAWIKFYLLSV